MKHKCDKEKELAEMGSDIKFIKGRLVGNGEKGMFRLVNELRADMNTLKNYNHIKNWILGGAVAVLTGLIGILLGIKI